MVLIGQRITVLGAGIGGLAAALALALRGASVRVIEQSPEIAEVGAGLQISPNGSAVLEALGLKDAFEAVSMASNGAVLRDFARGAEVLRLDLTGFGRFGLVHRADLIAVLERGAREAGVEIVLDRKVADVRLDGPAPVLRFEDGTEEDAAVLVGADGLHSRTRAAILGEAVPSFTNQVAWRALVPITPGEVADEAQVFMGPGRHLVAYPLRGGTVLNLVGVEEFADWSAEGWNHPGEPKRMRAIFARFGGPVQDWLTRVEDVRVWGLFRHPVAPRWIAPGAALLGDAAHPTLPFLAQGACLALEDAWVLGQSLAGHDGVDAGLAAYQAARIERARRTVAAATANARNYHLRSVPVRRVAHAGLRMIGRVAPDFMPDRFAWLYSHDVTKS
ncbi:FAD-dependent monooxygenase [Tropicimonas sp. IMCC34043]|uniref:FAD-dependent monooxygenase n=1 Tax=Tropicimonas sp. IMCC34043 TaxID=2248760 RepID=UPI000E2739D8|nr:FAD-dependent monooxygenase [Tropicimonas sp. IMCC34043]